ncbi:hypothetical protein [Mesorhizobium sp. M1163]|uniref:hypothetical protein n=1 Tax=Mesorhizobium sp. M1163 TaxID=2957065 RepID=UPI00333679E1
MFVAGYRPYKAEKGTAAEMTNPPSARGGGRSRVAPGWAVAWGMPGAALFHAGEAD